MICKEEQKAKGIEVKNQERMFREKENKEF